MASQNNGFEPVKFSITTPFHNVRLIEVTDDLLSIIEAGRNQNDKTAILKFKSAPVLTGRSSLTRNSSTSQGKDSILHLCSEDKAWAIKQVSTSNSVYLIQPGSSQATQRPPPTSGGGDDDEDMPEISDALTEASRGSVTATSQVRNFLELHPVKIDEDGIESMIQDLLPLYQNPDMLEEIDPIEQMHQSSKPALGLSDLIANVASPDSTVRRICARLGIFEASRDPSTASNIQCYIPSATALLATWAKIMETSAIELIKLDHAINAQRIADALPSDTDKAIAQIMLQPAGMFEQHGLIESATTPSTPTLSSDGNIPDTNTTSTRYFKPQETSTFIASLLLHSIAAKPTTNTITKRDGQSYGQIEIQSFLRQWTDLVPSSFVKHCTPEILTSISGVSITDSDPTPKSHNQLQHPPLSSTSTSISAPTQLQYPQTADSPLLTKSPFRAVTTTTTTKTTSKTALNTTAKQAESPATKPAASTGTGAGTANKRKWHEKFGAQRDAMTR